MGAASPAAPAVESFQRAAYRERNVVERLMNRLKQRRRVATRYEQRAANHLATATIAATRLWSPSAGPCPPLQKEEPMRRALVLATVLSLVVVPAQSQPGTLSTSATPVPARAYAIAELGTLGGERSRVWGLNEAGQAVGSADDGEG